MIGAASTTDPASWPCCTIELDQALSGLGFKEENRLFRAHHRGANRGRVQDPAAFRAAVREFAQTEFGVAHANEVVAYASTLTQDGPIYAPLCRAESPRSMGILPMSTTGSPGRTRSGRACC